MLSRVKNAARNSRRTNFFNSTSLHTTSSRCLVNSQAVHKSSNQVIICALKCVKNATKNFNFYSTLALYILFARILYMLKMYLKQQIWTSKIIEAPWYRHDCRPFKSILGRQIYHNLNRRGADELDITLARRSKI